MIRQTSKVMTLMLCLWLGHNVPAFADIIGENLVFEYLFPDASTVYGSQSFTVSDSLVEVSSFDLGNGATMDIDFNSGTSSFTFDSGGTLDWAFYDSTFNGPSIIGFSDSGNNLTYAAISLSSTIAGVSIADSGYSPVLAHGPNGFAIDWEGMPIHNSVINVDFETSPLSPPPAPDATLLTPDQKAELERISNVMSVNSLAMSLFGTTFSKGIEKSVALVTGLNGILLDGVSQNASDKAIVKAAAIIGISLGAVATISAFAFGVIPFTAAAVTLAITGVVSSIVGATAAFYAFDPPDLDYESAPVSVYQEANFADPHLEEVINVALRLVDYAGMATQAFEKYQGALIFEGMGIDTSLAQRVQIDNYDKYQALYENTLEELLSLLADLRLDYPLEIPEGQVEEIIALLEQGELPPLMDGLMDQYGFDRDVVFSDLIAGYESIDQFVTYSGSFDAILAEGNSLGVQTRRTDVPEPSAIALLALGLLGLAFAPRKCGNLSFRRRKARGDLPDYAAM